MKHNPKPEHWNGYTRAENIAFHHEMYTSDYKDITRQFGNFVFEATQLISKLEKLKEHMKRIEHARIESAIYLDVPLEESNAKHNFNNLEEKITLLLMGLEQNAALFGLDLKQFIKRFNL